MTVIYTETHLISDPLFSNMDIVSFNVALSSMSVECRVHREELIQYIQAKKLRTGDLIQLFGVLLTETKPFEFYYININHVELTDQFDIHTGKKRKFEQMQIDPSSWEARTSEPLDERLAGFVSVNGDFSNYFFMLYGKVQYAMQILNSIHSSNSSGSEGDDYLRTKQQLVMLQKDGMEQLNSLIQTIYTTYTEMQQKGYDKDTVMRFVEAVKGLTGRLNTLGSTTNHTLPPGLVIDHKIYLPELVYRVYAASLR